MKRLIRASLSPSMPDWLVESINNRNSIKRDLVKKYNIALDRAQFSDHAESNSSIPIYLLKTDYRNIIYCPGVNDDDQISINGRYRKLGSIAKSKLPEMAVDVVFVDRGNPDNTFANKERYRDPRYSYRNDPRGSYAGQYREKKYVEEDGQSHYEDGDWSKAGRRPANERNARDKSGYKIPDPVAKITEYYTRFPDRVTDKVDQVYDRLKEVRTKLMEADFDSPVDYHEDNIAKAYRYFGDALHSYRQLLNRLDGDRRLKFYNNYGYFDEDIADFSQTIRSIKSDLNDVEELIGLR